MIEKIVLDYLSEKLDCPVYMEMPEYATAPLVIIEKTGGGKRRHIYDAMLAIQSYGETLYKAAELNELVKTAMDGIIELIDIGSCELFSDYDFTNYNQSSNKMYRYQAVYQIVHY